MKHADFGKQHYRHAAAFTLADLRTKYLEQGLDIALFDVGAGRAGKECLQSLAMLPTHGCMVPESSTTEHGERGAIMT